MKLVVLSYNHPELTARTLVSARTLVPDSDILLVHNGSLSQHQKRLQTDFPEIEHLVLTQNRHYSGGANAGLKKAFETTDWVLFLTNDCQLLSLQIPDEAPSLIAPLIFARKQNRIDSLGGSFNVHKAHLAHCKSKEEFQNCKHPYVPGTAFWIHREIFEKTKGFDESLQTYWEDVDLSLRAQAFGFPLQTDTNTQVLHAIGKTCHKDTHYTTYLYQRNRKRISLKYASQKLSVYGSLWKSWIVTGTKLAQKKQWEKLKLLSQAILE